jgi:1-deoxy-D-xylulose-5-phosphate reductoisomerase
MRVPIAYGLAWPERIESGAARLDLLRLKDLTFEPVDAARFPGLQLAYEALRGPEGSAVVLNAANEVAVAAFLRGTIGFPAIHSLNRRTLDDLAGRFTAPGSVDELIALDTRAREVAQAAARDMSA